MRPGGTPDPAALAGTFIEALSAGAVTGEMLADSVAFTALNDEVAGRADVLDWLNAPQAGAPYRAAVWQAPQPADAGVAAAAAPATALTVRGTLPEGWRWSALILTLQIADGRIVAIGQQGAAAARPPTPGLALPDSLKAMIGSALAGGHPMLLSHVDESGQPVLSFRGSTQAIAGDRLAIWLRNRDGGFARAIARNPRVALMYRDADSKATYQFQGRARIDDDPALRARVYDAAPRPERHHDFARSGAVVVIELDRVQGYAGLGPNGPIDPIHLVRADRSSQTTD